MAPRGGCGVDKLLARGCHLDKPDPVARAADAVVGARLKQLYGRRVRWRRYTVLSARPGEGSRGRRFGLPPPDRRCLRHQRQSGPWLHAGPDRHLKSNLADYMVSGT